MGKRLVTVVGILALCATPRGWAQQLSVGDPAPAIQVKEFVKGTPVSSLEKGKRYVVEFWATWCGPCVAELPELVTMNRMYRGRNFQLVTLSIDDVAKQEDALKVLKENHVSVRNLISSALDRDKFAEALDQEWPGPIPYTLLIAPGGKVLYRKSGAIDPLEVKRAIVGFLGRTY